MPLLSVCHAGLCSLRQTLTLLPSVVKFSFSSRANQLDAREQQLIRQLRSLFQLAECYLAMLIQISPDGARRTIDLCLHLLPRLRQMVPAALSICACISYLAFADGQLMAVHPTPDRPAGRASAASGAARRRPTVEAQTIGPSIQRVVGGTLLELLVGLQALAHEALPLIALE